MIDRCPDCGVAVAEEHGEGCDWARCLWTGGQRLQCDSADHDCGHDVWGGEFPGVAEAVEYGFWCFWGPPWIACSEDHRGAVPDLNRVALLPWDRERQRHVLR